MTLHTERLVIRRLHDGDAPFILALLNDPDFIAFVGDRNVRTLDAARDYIASGPIVSYAQHGFGLCLVELRSTEEPMGICGLLKRDVLSDPDIGFAFMPPYRSKGYAREAAAAVMDDARRQLRIGRLLAIVNPSNERSIRLLERLGFVYDSMTRLAPESPHVKMFRSEA